MTTDAHRKLINALHEVTTREEEDAAVADFERTVRLEELRELRWRTRKKDYDLHPAIADYVDSRIAALSA